LSKNKKRIPESKEKERESEMYCTLLSMSGSMVSYSRSPCKNREGTVSGRNCKVVFIKAS
jgi:hypothetical protein